MKNTQSKKSLWARFEAEWDALTEEQKEGYVILMLLFVVIIGILLCAWFTLGLAASGGFGYAVAFLIVVLSFAGNIIHLFAK